MRYTAADSVESFGKLSGIHFVCALEHHVLDEVGDAGKLFWLVTGAAFNPDTESAGADGWHVLVNDADAIFKCDCICHNFVCPFSLF